MKKKLPASDIANELSGHSVFFTAQARNKPEKSSEVPEETNATAAPKTKPTGVAGKPHSPGSTPASSHDTVTPRNHDTELSGNQAQVSARAHATMTPTATTVEMSPAMLEDVRKAVKQLGKEAATHRFTPEEKRTIADLVYTYQRQGYRTSENEITRIAVNWLLLDFKERGEQSVLAGMLEQLHG